MTARIARHLAKEWSEGVLRVPGSEFTKDDNPPPLPDSVIEKIPGAKALESRFSAEEWTVVTPMQGRFPIRISMVEKWRNAPAEYRQRFDRKIKSHEKYESLLVDLDAHEPEGPELVALGPALDVATAETTLESAEKLKSEKSILAECEFTINGAKFTFYIEQDGNVWALHTEDGEKTFPKGTHLGGLGGGAFKLKDQSKVEDISLPFVFPEGDRSEIQYVGFETAADIKRSNIFNMFTDAERHGHVNFSLAFHEIKKMKKAMAGSSR